MIFNRGNINKSEPVLGLVLSGGGVRGLAHIGVIKALEEERIEASYVSGASAGAIVGALYAANYSSQEMLDFFHNTSLFSINNYAYGKPGFIDTDKFYQIFKQYFPSDNFKDLKKKLFVSATDILAGKGKIFHEGPLIHAILASAAFPVVLSPIEINQVFYADGGITNNFPVEPLIHTCDKIIGVFVNPLHQIKPEELNSSRVVMSRAFDISMANVSIQKFKECDLVIAPEKLSSFGTFSMSYLDEAFNIGYEEAKSRIGDIRKLKEVNP